MSLLSGDTWPATFLTYFATLWPQAEARTGYNGLYNTMLFEIFANSRYRVWPERPCREHENPEVGALDPNSMDYGMFFVIRDSSNEFLPVFVVHVKHDSWANTADLRSKADAQMRHRLNSLLQDCPIPRLWGLSLLGTTLRVYCGEVSSGKIEPPFEPFPEGGVVPENYLEGQWGVSILSQEAFGQIKEIVGYISEECKVLAEAP